MTYYIIKYNVITGRFAGSFSYEINNNQNMIEIPLKWFNFGKNKLFITTNKEEFDKKIDELFKLI